MSKVRKGVNVWTPRLTWDMEQVRVQTDFYLRKLVEKKK